MIFTTKKGKDLWPSLWLVRDQAEEQVIEVIRGCILATVEHDQEQDLTNYLKVSKAVSQVHDAYYEGRKWLFDFDAKLEVVPGHRYYVRPVMGKLLQHASDFMAERHSPFKTVPGKGINWSDRFTIQICDRDVAGALFAIAEDRIMKSPNIVYPPHYRMISKHVKDMQGIAA